MTDVSLIALYTLPLLCLWAVFAARRAVRNRKVLATSREASEAGLTEPASLHPVIDDNICIGCAACVTACPEGEILGLVSGKARLIEPTRCIGHGACAAACPVGGIQLVFGTEKRGVDIPNVAPDFQTNVPGIYIAGELGGMGLIRNAIEQGRQAMEHIAKATRRGAGLPLDVLIVGAGPSGISAALAAKKAGLKFKIVDQDTLGGTVSHFPRGKLVMTAPAELPLVGKVKFREVSKEKLLDFWQDVVRDNKLEILTGHRVDAIEPISSGFSVTTTQGEFQTAAVLLCIGRRGTPRKLGVPGEEQTKVVYRLIDAAQYRDMKVLVVGGGDSAIEAATTIAEEPGTTVTISYRSEGFSRAKAKNRQKLEELQSQGRLDVQLSSTVAEIKPDKVLLQRGSEILERANDAVIICAGGILPTGFLKSIGIEVETKHGEA